jgi:hypothetical protein
VILSGHLCGGNRPIAKISVEPAMIVYRLYADRRQ